jgi:hypothetical protein
MSLIPTRCSPRQLRRYASDGASTSPFPTPEASPAGYWAPGWSNVAPPEHLQLFPEALSSNPAGALVKWMANGLLNRGWLGDWIRLPAEAWSERRAGPQRSVARASGA